MALTLHVGARSSGVDRLLTERWRQGGGLLVARDEHSLAQALDAATAGGAVWGCRAGTFATLFGRARELAGLAEAERRASAVTTAGRGDVRIARRSAFDASLMESSTDVD